MAVSAPAKVSPPVEVKSVPALPMLVIRLVLASNVPASVNAPSVEVEESKLIVLIPVTAPIVEMSQSEELMATVSPLSPRVTIPLAVRELPKV